MNDLFKSQVVLELEKDNAFYNAAQFKVVIEKKYGFIPDNSVYLKIINYQIDRYGESLNPRQGNRPRFLSRKQRERQKDRNYRKYHEDALIERAEKREKENMVHAGKTS